MLPIFYVTEPKVKRRKLQKKTKKTIRDIETIIIPVESVPLMNNHHLKSTN